MNGKAACAGPRSLAPETTDVIVAAAGPASSPMACYPATAGLDMLMPEKTCLPREKACGEGLTSRTERCGPGDRPVSGKDRS